MNVVEFSKAPDARGNLTLRIEDARFFADIVWDRRSQSSVYYVIMQQRGSSAVLGIARYDSMDEARRAAELNLEMLAIKAA